MKRYGILGPAAPEHGWVPAPRYLLRRSRILRQLQALAPCEALEVGCGPAVLLHELDDLGFRCSALESSSRARDVANLLASAAGKRVDLRAAPGADWAGRFRLLMAFEVLEHIEDDAAALRQWREWMAPGGTLLLSVPSHMAKWNPSDVWAGHYRRYERRQLVDLMAASGFRVELVECYGFPLANMAEKVRARQYGREVDEGVDLTPGGKQANSERSGTDRRHVMAWFPLLRSPAGKLAMIAADLAQRPFLSTELGNGYFVRATAC